MKAICHDSYGADFQALPRQESAFSCCGFGYEAIKALPRQLKHSAHDMLAFGRKYNWM